MRLKEWDLRTPNPQLLKHQVEQPKEVSKNLRRNRSQSMSAIRLDGTTRARAGAGRSINSATVADATNTKFQLIQNSKFRNIDVELSLQTADEQIPFAGCCDASPMFIT